MKSYFFILGIIALVLAPLPSGAAVPVKPAMELIEYLAAKAGRAPAKGATEALELALRTHGPRVLVVSRHAGLGLVEAAARYGDEVFAMAIRVPEAAPALALQAGNLLPLARRYGDDFLRLEAKAPGLAEDAFRLFSSKEDMTYLLGMPVEELRTVLPYVAHANDTIAAKTLLKAVRSKGVDALKQLDHRTILAVGLSTAAVVGATGVSLTAGERIAAAGEAILKMPTMLVAAVLCALLVVTYIPFFIHKILIPLGTFKLFRRSSR